jgi:hypothetical protein
LWRMWNQNPVKSLVICTGREYNLFRKIRSAEQLAFVHDGSLEVISWSVRSPVILNLHLLQTGIPTLACGCQALIAQEKAEAVLAVTHLASLGVKRQERHPGVTLFR